jgi:acetyltransferase-like isoleucine patch superfamily enzyme
MVFYKLLYSFREKRGLFTFKKIILWTIRKFSIKLLLRIKAIFYFNSKDLLLGSNVKISGLCPNINIGKNNNFYPNSIFEFGANSSFVTGDNVILSYGVLVSCMKSIEIGSFVQIGEYTSIRDTTHNYKESIIMGSKDVTFPISIGNNIWIGRGCLISEGTIIEDGVIIGANSYVKGRLKKDGIYAGSPAKLIKNRFE